MNLFRKNKKDEGEGSSSPVVSEKTKSSASFLKKTVSKIGRGFGKNNVEDLDTKPMSNAEYLGEIYKLMVKNHDDIKIERQQQFNRKEEEDFEDQKRHSEIIKALTLRRKPKRVVRREKKVVPSTPSTPGAPSLPTKPPSPPDKTKDAVDKLRKKEAEEAAAKAKKEAEEAARKQAETKARKEAEEAAAKAKRKAEEEAADAAAKARKKAEEEAADAAAKARKKAEEEAADKAKRKAEEEAADAAAKAKRKAEEEAEEAAAKAKRKAEEEAADAAAKARKKAEEEAADKAKRKAEEEAADAAKKKETADKLKREEEAARKAEEAKKKAERVEPEVPKPPTAKPTKKDKKQPPTATKEKKLGDLSKKYESGAFSKPAGVIGYDSKGGTSYGAYQISSPTMADFLTFLESSGEDDMVKRLKAVLPADTGSTSGKFPDEWQKIADEDPEGFLKLQHDFIEKTKYEPAIEFLKEIADYDIEKQSSTIKDVFWSTVVHHGPGGYQKDRKSGKIIKDKAGNPLYNGAVDIFRGAIVKAREEAKATAKKEKIEYDPDAPIDDAVIIENVYTERPRRFPSSTEEVRKSVQKRLVNEKGTALEMLDEENKALKKKMEEEKQKSSNNTNTDVLATILFPKSTFPVNDRPIHDKNAS
jgi:hypothetical protein